MRKPILPFDSPRPEPPASPKQRRRTFAFSIVSGIVGWLGLGVIAGEIMRRTDLLPANVPPIGVGFVCVAGFLIHMWLSVSVNRLKNAGRPLGRQRRIFVEADRYVIALLFLLAAISIPYLWWGVIKQLAAGAGISPPLR